MYKAFIFILFCCISCSFSRNKQESKGLPPEKTKDSIVHFARNYINYMDNLDSRGQYNRKIYARKARHSKFISIINQAHWPDSLAETINVVTYKNEPVVYMSVPLATSGNNYTEHDWYFYKSRIIAMKEIYTEFSSNCTANHGILSEQTITIFDTLGNTVSKDFKAVDSDNRSVEAPACKPASENEPPVYKSFSETPFAKEGVEEGNGDK